jgi:nucleoside-diphosphate-sugar epimerase
MDVLDFLIVGAGYVGRRLAHTLATRGSVGAVVRRADSAAVLLGDGINVTACDLDDSLPARPPSARCVLYLVPPPSEERTDPRMTRWLAAMRAPDRFVYLSTTAVYGHTHGGPVSEDTPAAPGTDRGHRRFDAETQVQADGLARGYDTTLLRVPGIYGPGRLPLERLQRGEPVLAEGEAGVTNRIHVDDLVTALSLCATHPKAAGKLYNVTDGAPCSTSEHLRRIAALAGLPSPPEVSRKEAAGRIPAAFLSYLDESRLVESQRIVRDLGFSPRYADPLEGIRASLADQTGFAVRS